MTLLELPTAGMTHVPEGIGRAVGLRDAILGKGRHVGERKSQKGTEALDELLLEVVGNAVAILVVPD